MSDSILIRNDSLIEYIPMAEGEYPTLTEAAAGGGLKTIIGIVASIAIPFAAPAIFGAVASSGFLGATIAAAASSPLVATLGSAITGGLLNAAVAYATGARGGDVWRAAAMGGLGGGLSGYSRAATAAAQGAQGGLNAIGGTGPVSLAPPTTTAAPGAAAEAGLAGVPGSAASAGAGGGFSVGGSVGNIISSGFRHLANNPELANRLIAAATLGMTGNNYSEQMQALINARRAELKSMTEEQRAQEISLARQITEQAKRIDPDWLGKLAAANTAVAMNREHTQALKTIATEDPFSSGKAKTYRRQGRLEIGRAKSAAYNTAKIQGEGEKARALAYAQQAWGLSGLGNYLTQTGELDTAQAGLYGNEAERGNQIAGLLISGNNYGQPDPGYAAYEEERRRRAGGGFPTG